MDRELERGILCSRLPSTSKLVLLALASHADADRVASPPLATLARETSLDARTIRRHLAKLSTRGRSRWLLERKVPGGPTAWTLRPPRPTPGSGSSDRGSGSSDRGGSGATGGESGPVRGSGPPPEPRRTASHRAGGVTPRMLCPVDRESGPHRQASQGQAFQLPRVTGPSSESAPSSSSSSSSPSSSRGGDVPASDLLGAVRELASGLTAPTAPDGERPWKRVEDPGDPPRAAPRSVGLLDSRALGFHAGELELALRTLAGGARVELEKGARDAELLRGLADHLAQAGKLSGKQMAMARDRARNVQRWNETSRGDPECRLVVGAACLVRGQWSSDSDKRAWQDHAGRELSFRQVE